MRKNVLGMTLPELVVTMVLMAIIVMSSVPSFNNWIVRSRQHNLAKALQNAMWIARMEAIKSNQRAIACPSRDLQTCSGQTDWENGWLIFVDVNDERSLTPENLVPIHVEAGQFPGVVAFGNQPVRNYFSYVGNGWSQQLGGAFLAGTITVCAQGQNKIEVIMASSGRPRINRTKTPC